MLQDGLPYTMWMQVRNITGDGEDYPLALNPLGGNVGIGTTTPQWNFVVSQPSGYANAQVVTAASGSPGGGAQFFLTTGAHSYSIGTRVDGTYGDVNAFNIRDETNGATRLLIDPNGNVGIGTGTANGKLDVYNSGDNGDGIVIQPDLDADNSTAIQTYIDSTAGGSGWANRKTYAGGCCNELALQPDVGFVTIGGTGTGAGDALTVDGNADITGTLNAGAYTGLTGATNVTPGMFGANDGGTTGSYAFPGDLYTAAGASEGGGFYDLAASHIGVVNSLYSYGDICTGNSNGDCADGSGGVVIGNVNSAALVNITNDGSGKFAATLAVGTSAYVNQSGDIGASRNAAPTTGVIYLGSGGAHYLYFDGTNYNLNAGGLNVGGTITGNDYLQLNAYPGFGSGTGQMYYCGTCNSFVMNNPLNVSGDVEDTNPSLGYLALTGDLPGYSASQYPTLKTNYTYMYFSANGNYTAALGGSGIFQLNGSGTTVLNSSGSSYFTGGYVGIGTTAPNQVLQLDSSGNTALVITNNTIGSGSGHGLLIGNNGGATSNYQIYNYDNGSLSFGTDSNYDMTILANGNVGIGTTSPGGTLDVNGDIRGNTDGSGDDWFPYANGDIYMRSPYDYVTNTIQAENGNWFINNSGVAAFVDTEIAPGNGNAICFWQDCSNYAIAMGNGSYYDYGPVTDYSIRNTMSNTAGRGWTWGANGVNPIAALNTAGTMEIAGHFEAGGGTPSSASCGYVESGSTDTQGKIYSYGSSGSSCTVYFATSYTNIPVCVVTALNAGPSYALGGGPYAHSDTWISTTYDGYFVFNQETTIASGEQFSYICLGT